MSEWTTIGKRNKKAAAGENGSATTSGVIDSWKKGFHEAMTWNGRNSTSSWSNWNHDSAWQHKRNHGRHGSRSRWQQWTWAQWQRWHEQWRDEDPAAAAPLPKRPPALAGDLPPLPAPPAPEEGDGEDEAAAPKDEDGDKLNTRAARRALVAARDAIKLLKGDQWASCMSTIEDRIKESEPEQAAPSLRKRYEAADKYLIGCRRAAEEAVSSVKSLRDKHEKALKHQATVNIALTEAEGAHKKVLQELAGENGGEKQASEADDFDMTDVSPQSDKPTVVVAKLQTALHAVESSAPSNLDAEYMQYVKQAEEAGGKADQQLQWVWKTLTSQVMQAVEVQPKPPALTAETKARPSKERAGDGAGKRHQKPQGPPAKPWAAKATASPGQGEGVLWPA